MGLRISSARLRSTKVYISATANLENIFDESAFECIVHVEVVVINEIFERRPLNQRMEYVEAIQVVVANTNEICQVIVV